MYQFADKTVLVTGGGKGIGRAISQRFAELGAGVVVVGRDRVHAPDAVGDFVSADLATREGCREVADFFARTDRSLDVIVNNAGIARFAPLAETDDVLLEWHVELNLLGPYRLTRMLLPRLVRGGGSVINISSYFARKMLAGRPSSAYSMTKGGLEALTKAWAFELGPQGIRVNAIAPGTVDTPLFRHNLEALSADERERFERAVPALYPLGRLGLPGDIAGAAAFLASDEAKWITGVVLPADGGLMTH